MLLVLLVCQGHSQTKKAVKDELANLSADEDLKNASISFYAIDLNNNHIIAGVNPNTSLVPASTNKLVTTASALEILGANTRFSTQILYTGKIDTLNRVLYGDIIIKGGGDPCLGSFRYKKYYEGFINKWASSIKNLKVDSIAGRVIADASIFTQQMIPSTWIWGDLGNYYGAGPSGLSIYENMCRVEFVSGKKKGDTTYVSCINPYIPEFNIENRVISMEVKRDESYFYGAPYDPNRLVKGSIPLNKKEFEVKSSIPDPALLAAFELDMELRSIGVKIANTYTTQRQLGITSKDKELHLITKTYSPKLSSIVKQTNTHSVNLYAEHLLNQIGIKKYRSGDPESGTLAITEFWKSKGIDVDGFYMNDGSGLSRFNVLTSRQLVLILRYMNNSDNYSTFFKSLPIAGKTGTIRSIGRKTEAENNLRAKSGYMTRVRSYAGYVTSKSKRNIAFAMIVNNYNCTPYQMKKKMEKIMIKLAEIND